MQISPIKNSRKTNFGMALKINPASRPFLEEQPTKYLKNLEKVGKDLEDVKYFHVILEHDGKLSVIKENDARKKDFLYYFNKEEDMLGKRYDRSTDEETVGGIYPDTPDIFRYLYDEDAKGKYKEFKKLDKLNQAAELSKLLNKEEKINIDRIKRENAEKNQRLNAKMQEENQKLEKVEKINNLISDFKLETNEVDSQTPKSKSIFKRFLDLFKMDDAKYV